jgi:hypothetical protein
METHECIFMMYMWTNGQIICDVSDYITVTFMVFVWTGKFSVTLLA